jgi:hypothetical protein
MVDSFRNPPEPQVADREYGAVAALWSVEERLNLQETLDKVFPKRNDGPSIGTYLTIGALSRCLEPVIYQRRELDSCLYLGALRRSITQRKTGNWFCVGL